MADYEATSISKCVFAFKKGQPVSLNIENQPKSKKKRGRKSFGKRVKVKNEEENSHNLYKRTCNVASIELEQLQRQMFSDVLKAVVEYCQLKSKKFFTDSSNLMNNSNTIPTCAVLTGINLPDHEDFFKLLREDLRHHISPHISSIRMSGYSSAGANMTQKSLIQNVVAQFLQVGYEEEEELEDEEEIERAHVKKADLSFYALETWYEQQHKGCSPRKKKRISMHNSQRPPLIIILEDFEMFSGPVLQEFILNLVEHSERLPFILVFGVATNVTILHQRLPGRISNHLEFQKFSGQKSIELLTKLIEKIIMNPQIPFKLNGNCLNLLLEMFLFNNFSIKGFFSAYKYCLFTHYHGSTLSELLCANSKIRKESIKKLDPLQLDECRSMPSFRKYIEADIEKRARFLIDDDLFRKFLDQSLEFLDIQTAKFNIAVEILYEISRDLPGKPLGQHLQSTYSRCLERRVVESHDYRDAYQYLGLLNLENLMAKLQAALDILGANFEVDFGNAFEEGRTHMKRLKDFVNQKNNPSTPKANSETPKSNTPNTPTLNKRLKFHELKATLQQSVKEKKKESPFELLRKEVLDYLHNFFKDYLISPTELPCSEVKYFHKVETVKRHLMAFPRKVIRVALTDPYVYLEDDRLDIVDEDEIPAFFPHISVLFKLQSQMGNIINLYDLLQAWLSIVDEDSDDNDELDPVLQARFTEAVSALQFMGYVKPSKRKTDHLKKLTWGD